jgi:membrane protease YdiL (CAAX protease family)
MELENRTNFRNNEPESSSFITQQDPGSGYAYIPGTGFVLNDPAVLQRRHLRYIAGHVGIAMIFYILLAAFITLPVVLMYSAMGFPVSLNFNTMRVYGTQLMLQVVSLTTTVVKLGIPALFLWGSLRHYAKVSPIFSVPRFRILRFALPITLAGSVLGAFGAELLQRGMTALGYYVAIPSYSIPDEPFEFILSMVLLTVIPAVLEEVLFRGLVMQGLRCFGDGIALAASSVLFALAHFNLIQGANALLMGLIIGYFVLRTGSIWVGVVLHFAVNVLSFFETLLFRTVLMGQSELVGNLVALVLLLAGFAAFILFIRKENTAFSIPLLKNSTLSSSKRLALCFGSTGMVLAFILFVFFGLQMGI